MAVELGRVVKGIISRVLPVAFKEAARALEEVVLEGGGGHPFEDGQREVVVARRASRCAPVDRRLRRRTFHAVEARPRVAAERQGSEQQQCEGSGAAAPSHRPRWEPEAAAGHTGGQHDG